ncbi:MAG TPA: ABC transporter permease [Rudaea sp.]|jgi:osmoprotectant transport system permease protein|nr:ABC transporter permease [Rudaea sp.]
MSAFMLEIVRTSGEHVVLVATAVTAAFAIGAPAAIALTLHARTRRWVLGAVNVIQTIPSLALFGVLLPIPLIGGIGKRTAIIVLALYALLPIMRNMVVGILGVEASIRESALAMGMTRQQILRRVEIPLALPTILAGLRIAIVSTIGTATVAAAIGGGGLGTFIFRGIATADLTTVLAGAVPAAVMAIIADEVLEWAERRYSV